MHCPDAKAVPPSTLLCTSQFDWPYPLASQTRRQCGKLARQFHHHREQQKVDCFACTAPFASRPSVMPSIPAYIGCQAVKLQTTVTSLPSRSSSRYSLTMLLLDDTTAALCTETNILFEFHSELAALSRWTSVFLTVLYSSRVLQGNIFV